MRIHLRRVLLASICVFLSCSRAPVRAADQAPARAEAIPIVWGGDTVFRKESDAIEWGGHEYRLIKIAAIRFELDKKTGGMRAAATAGITTFDRVDYDVSIAVFDAADELLGVARVQCPIERLWVTKVMLESRKLEFDFGQSLDYARATKFKMAISKRPIMTPAHWQK
jgi:hypothetical protein